MEPDEPKDDLIPGEITYIPWEDLQHGDFRAPYGLSEAAAQIARIRRDMDRYAFAFWTGLPIVRESEDIDETS